MRFVFTEHSRLTDGYIASFSPLEYTSKVEDAYHTLDMDIYSYTDTDLRNSVIDPLMKILKVVNEFDIVINVLDEKPDGTLVSIASIYITDTGISLMGDEDLDTETVRTLKHISSDISMYGFELADVFTSKDTAVVTDEIKKLADKSTADSAKTKGSEDSIIAEVQKRCQADIIKPKENLADYVCDDLLKEELTEIKSFIENEALYKSCGVSTPKGILLKGAPGTGKTYAARCIAGEVDCFFMVCTASSLQGQYIGSGAQNVKDLFNGAKILHKETGKGVIIFIDELDSFGDRATHNGNASGEENRTINQLLAELSGFEDIDGIMVMGATNYPDRIDDALMRAGRFSRQITIRKPEWYERLHMIDYYFNKIKMPLSDTDFGTIAELTKGLTPADIKEIANESAILAIRYKESSISIDHINEAVNKVITKNIRTPDGKLDQHRVGAHEAGHVLAEYIFNGNIAIKVTNYSYGDAGGFTQPSEYLEGLFTAERMLNEVKVLLAGRVAEEIICGDITNGASNDLYKAKKLLEAYYKEYNFEKYETDKLKQIVIDKLDSLYMETLEELQLPHNCDKLKEITSQLQTERVLYSADLAKILITGGFTL